MRWRELALALIEAANSGDVDAWEALEAEAAEKTERVYLQGLYRRTVSFRSEGRFAPHERRDDGRCAGCMNVSPNLAGAYCPTCRQRGAKNGWCDLCGGALYQGGVCRSTRSHGGTSEELARGA